MSILDRLFSEDRNETEFQYTNVTKTGKETQDKESVTKVIATLKSYTAGKTTKLANEFEEMLRQKQKIDASLEELKDKSRDLFNDLFDAEDALWTRVLETSKVTLTLSKETVRKTINFNHEKFIDMILKLTPELSKEIQKFATECVEVKETKVKSTVKPELKEEGFHDILSKIKTYVTKIKNNVSNWVKSYDNKLDLVKKDLDNYIIKDSAVKESYLNRANNFLI